MKKLLLFLIFAVASVVLVAQNVVTIGVKIPNNTVLDQQAQQVLANKLNQLTTLNNVGSNDVNSRFELVPQVSIVQSDISPSAQPKQLVKLNIVLMVSDNANTKNIVAQTEISSKGVGRNEKAAILDALQQINVRSATLKRFMEQAKKKLAELPPVAYVAEAKSEAAPASTEAGASAAKGSISIESCHPDIVFTVTQCTKVGSSFLMKFTVLNQGSKDINSFSFVRHESQAFDNEGNAYRLEYIELGNNANSLPKGLKIKGELQVKNIDDQATDFVQIKLYCVSYAINLTSSYITLHNVPIVLQ